MIRRPGTHSWRPVLAPIASFVVMGVWWGAWAALLPDVKRSTSASEPELGSALLWMGAGALPAMLITGRLWRRFDRRLVSAALFIYGCVSILPSLAPDPLALAVAMTLVGAASGSLDVSMNAALSDVEVGTGRRLMYLAHGLFSLAVLVGSVTVGILRGMGVTPFIVLGTVGAAFFMVSAASLATDRHLPIIRRTRPPEDRARRRIPAGIVALGVLIGGAFLIEDAMISWSAIHLEDGLGAPPALGGTGPGVFSAAMFLGRWAGQPIGRRFSERAMLVGSGLVGAVGIAIVAVAPVAPVALLGLGTAGAGISVAAPALFSRAGRLAGPASRGAVVSMLTTFGYVGFVVGPPFVGLMAGATDLRVAFAGLAILAVAVAGGAYLALAPDDASRGAAGPKPLQVV